MTPVDVGDGAGGVPGGRCVVRDASSNGAGIGIARQHRLPKRFRPVTSGSTLGHPMRRAWRRGKVAGVMLAPATGAGSAAPRGNPG